MEIRTLKALKKSTKPVSGFTAEQEEITTKELEKGTRAIMGENLPAVKVADDDLIKVEFLGEPQPKPTRFGTDVAYAVVKMLQAHVGFIKDQSGNDEEVNLKVGDKAGLNVYRHKALRLQAESHAPLTGKKFIIGIVGELPSKKGKPAKDYRWMPIAT